jgi:hypothetical protein
MMGVMSVSDMEAKGLVKGPQTVEAVIGHGEGHIEWAEPWTMRREA